MTRTLLLALTLATLPLAASAQDWAHVSLLDRKCHDAGEDGRADTHTRRCLLHCAGSGFGIIDADGKWIALDARGNRLARKAIPSTRKADHLRVDVSGEVKDGALAVKELALAD